ncbi:MAG: hypothetical protein ACRDRL_00170 [Sciscionella sp.]
MTNWRLFVALEFGDYEQAAALSEQIDPTRIVAPTRQANYHVNTARALAHVRGRRDDAVRSLRRAEVISADKVVRNPVARDLLSELLARARHDATGCELRGMAYRAGLPV